MTLYQVLHELQIVLALILGACPLCCQPVTLDRLAAADAALYHAKETGRNKTHVVTASAEAS